MNNFLSLVDNLAKSESASSSFSESSDRENLEENKLGTNNSFNPGKR